MKKIKYIIELEDGKYWLDDSVNCDYTTHFDKATTWDDKELCQEWCNFIHERNIRGYQPKIREIVMELI